MVVDPFEAGDATQVAELAKLSGSGFDPLEEFRRPYARLWVVRRAESVPAHGFVLIWRAADEVHLLDLAVSPEERRAGTGRLLVDTVIRAAVADGARVILLEVRASNAAALSLYRSAGFLEHGVRRAYYSDNGEDAILMRLTITTDHEHGGQGR